MSALQSIVIALACFSAIPMPFVAWDERNMRYMMAAFPLVGVVMGAAIALWGLVCWLLAVGPVLRGAGVALIPLALTGGIHLDGFADVVDAESSHAAPERKRQIMKDPHVGAFAVAGISAYLLATFALATELDAQQLALFSFAPVVSRCLVGIATMTWPLASDKGMLASVVGAARRQATRLVLVVELVATMALMLICCYAVEGISAVLVGLVALAGAIAVQVHVRHVAQRDFGGMSGDIAGFDVQVTELAMLACIVLVGKLW